MSASAQANSAGPCPELRRLTRERIVPAYREIPSLSVLARRATDLVRWHDTSQRVASEERRAALKRAASKVAAPRRERSVGSSGRHIRNVRTVPCSIGTMEVTQSVRQVVLAANCGSFG